MKISVYQTIKIISVGLTAYCLIACNSNSDVDTSVSPSDMKMDMAQEGMAAMTPKVSNTTSQMGDMKTGKMGMMDHSHIPVAVPKNAPPPQMSLTLTPDSMSGYNLTLHTQNYEMSVPPSNMSMEELMKPDVNPKTGFVKGHAHLYVNGEKIQRIYGKNIHLPATLFKSGVNQMNVTINNHAHMFWTSDEKKVISSLFINADAPELIQYRFDSFPVMDVRSSK